MDPGITPLDLADLPDDLQRCLAPRVARLGYLGDFFRYCGHQPAALLHFYQFTEALKEALPADLTETVALTIAARTGNDYERAQHERLSRKLGFTDDWIATLVGPEDEPAGLTADQCDARALALRVLDRDWGQADERLTSLAASVGQEQAVGVLMLAARYLAHSAISNTLHLVAPPGTRAVAIAANVASTD